MFPAFPCPGPVVAFGGKQDSSEFPSGLAALDPGCQTASTFREPLLIKI
jgi:hypothetical protein